jgi:protein MPE1
MTGKIPVHAKNQSRKEQANKGSAKTITATNSMVSLDNMTEEERMNAMFAAQSENWSAQKEEMAK